MKLRPVLSAGTIGVLIAAGSAIPSFATGDETPREEVVSEPPASPRPEAEDESSPSPSDTESASEEPSEEPTEDEDEEEVETPSPRVIEYLLETTAPPATRPSVQAAEPSPATPEAPVTRETSSSPVVEADSGSNAANNDGAVTEANNQPMAAIPQNSGSATGAASNSNSSSGSSAQTQMNNPGTVPQGPIVSPLNLPITPAQNVQFFGADALAQALLDAQNPDDNAPVEEFTTGTSDAPGRIESRRIVEPNQPPDAATQDSIPEPQATPSAPQGTRPAPQDTRSVPEDIRSAPQDNLVTTGAASTVLAIGGVLLIASGMALLSWRRRTSK